jgi:hypothetical protein
VRKAQEKAAAASGNTALYVEAEANCKQRAVPLTIIAQCVQDYVAARTSSANPAPATTVPKELYTNDFISPKWSPDLAGWSVIVTSIFGGLLLWRSTVFLRRSHLLKHDL